MSEKVAAAAHAAILRELTEQSVWFQQRLVSAAARAGAAEARIQEMSAELETLKNHCIALEAENKALRPIYENGGTDPGNVVKMREGQAGDNA